MRLYTVEVYNLKMCIKGDNSMEIILCGTDGINNDLTRGSSF